MSEGEGEPSGDLALSAVAPGFELRAVEHIYRGLCAECAGALWQGATPGLRKRVTATTS